MKKNTNIWFLCFTQRAPSKYCASIHVYIYTSIYVCACLMYDVWFLQNAEVFKIQVYLTVHDNFLPISGWNIS